jgi:hypothetical protein
MHLTDDTLLQLTLDVLEPVETAVAMAHLKECAECRERFASATNDVATIGQRPPCRDSNSATEVRGTNCAEPFVLARGRVVVNRIRRRRTVHMDRAAHAADGDTVLLSGKYSLGFCCIDCFIGRDGCEAFLKYSFIAREWPPDFFGRLFLQVPALTS